MGNAAILIKGAFHGRDVVEVADEVDRPEGFAALDALAVQLLNEADVAALVAPGFGDRPRVERHARQPRPWLAIDFDVVSADHALGGLIPAALIEKPGIGREILRELRGRDRALVAEVDFAETLPVLVSDVPRHVDAIEDVVH